MVRCNSAARFLALVTTTVALAGCGVITGAGMQTTITLDEANQKLDDYIERSMNALPAETRLDERRVQRERACSDPDDNGPEGRKFASRSYEIVGLDPENIPYYFDTLNSWWESHNFRVLDNTPQYEFLWVENNDDSFRMTLRANQHGEMYLVASSPCVWPEGTPDPE